MKAKIDKKRFGDLFRQTKFASLFPAQGLRLVTATPESRKKGNWHMKHIVDGDARSFNSLNVIDHDHPLTSGPKYVDGSHRSRILWIWRELNLRAPINKAQQHAFETFENKPRKEEKKLKSRLEEMHINPENGLPAASIDHLYTKPINPKYVKRSVPDYSIHPPTYSQPEENREILQCVPGRFLYYDPNSLKSYIGVCGMVATCESILDLSLETPGRLSFYVVKNVAINSYGEPLINLEPMLPNTISNKRESTGTVSRTKPKFRSKK